MRYDRRKLKWNGWGWADHHYDLHGRDTEFWRFVKTTLELDDLRATPSLTLEQLPLADSYALGDALGSLSAIVGASNVKTDRFERAFHAVGKSYHDLLRLRAGHLPGAPDAVVYPGNADEVRRLLEWAAASHWAVVPYGGGSSVTGGVEAAAEGYAGVLTVDTTRLSRILEVDGIAQTASVEAGIYGPELERQLRSRGFTLGHFPQSFEFSTLGGWIAARGSGQQCNRYGSADKFLVSARLATPTGMMSTLEVPKSAAGPDMNHLVAGSEGILGIITDATVRLRSLPKKRDYRGYLFPSFAAGVAAIREMNQADLQLAMARLSDADETYFYSKFSSLGKRNPIKSFLTKRFLSMKGMGERPCLMLVGAEGGEELVDFTATAARRICESNRGLHLGTRPGDKWYEGRFEMPYLRDPIMDHGIGVDTLETATSWSNLTHLHAAVQHGIREGLMGSGGKPIVMAHVSHSYRDGASLYFTFIFNRDEDAPIAQWWRVKRAASDAIMENGGTISHHHGVGVDHLEWMPAEKGNLGLAMLRAAKNEVDPHHVLNPGKVLPKA